MLAGLVAVCLLYYKRKNKIPSVETNYDRQSEEGANWWEEYETSIAEKIIEEASGPAFDIGDPVIVINPLVVDNTVTAVDDDPIHTRVSRIAYVQDRDIFVYQLEGLTEWYNESWLQYDVYLPKTIRVIEVNPMDVKEARIDAILDEINDYKRLAEEFGDKEYTDRIENLKRELAEITKGMSV